MGSRGEPGKVSTFTRSLAWIFVGCCALVFVGIAYQLLTGHGMRQDARLWIGLVLGQAVFVPVFGYVAWTGRSPRFMTSMENGSEDEGEALGIPPSSSTAVGKIVSITSSVVFGLILFFFGNRLGIFDGEAGWLGIAVFAGVWLFASVVMWRNHGARGPDR